MAALRAVPVRRARALVAGWVGWAGGYAAVVALPSRVALATPVGHAPPSLRALVGACRQLAFAAAVPSVTQARGHNGRVEGGAAPPGCALERGERLDTHPAVGAVGQAEQHRTVSAAKAGEARATAIRLARAPPTAPVGTEWHAAVLAAATLSAHAVAVDAQAVRRVAIQHADARAVQPARARLVPEIATARAVDARAVRAAGAPAVGAVGRRTIERGARQ